MVVLVVLDKIHAILHSKQFSMDPLLMHMSEVCMNLGELTYLD